MVVRFAFHGRNDAMTTTVPTQRPSSGGLDDGYDEDGVWCPTREELVDSIEEAMMRLGLTRVELARQAEEGYFETWQAKSLWWKIECFGV
jgi:hypothetical protein